MEWEQTAIAQDDSLWLNLVSLFKGKSTVMGYLMS